MTDRKPIALRAALAATAVSLAGAAALAATRLPPAAPEPLTAGADVRSKLIDAARQRIARLLDNIEALEACALRADVTAVFHEAFGKENGVAIDTPIHGSFEFIAAGDAWRKRSFMDPALYRGMNTAIAYNGEFYEYGMLDKGVMTISRTGDQKAPGMTLPNPLIELGAFLAPASDDSDDVTLAQLRDACAAFDASTATWRVEADAASPHAVMELPGGTYLGSPYTFRAHVPADESAPLVIERVLPNGVVFLRTTFSKWSAFAPPRGDAQLWPATVVFEGFDPQTCKLAATMRMTITSFALLDPQDIDKDSLLLDWDAAERVWFDEPGVFIK